MARTANAKRRKKFRFFYQKSKNTHVAYIIKYIKVRFSKKRENNVNLNYYQNGTRR